jgi:hypothetical protein
MEGPMSPVLYMMKLYEQNVSPDFEEFNARALAEKQRKAADEDS